MEYSTPKKFVSKLDQTFLKFVSLPILFFFVYYCYFSYQSEQGILNTLKMSEKMILGYNLAWIIPVVIYFRKKKSILKKVQEEELMDDKLNVILTNSIKNYWLLLILFVSSIVVFCIVNHPLMSLPVWVMVIITSVEKPSIYRVGNILRFKTKDSYHQFINDEWP